MKSKGVGRFVVENQDLDPEHASYLEARKISESVGWTGKFKCYCCECFFSDSPPPQCFDCRATPSGNGAMTHTITHTHTHP